MSAEIIWMNRNLAVLARLYHLRNIQPVWTKQDDGFCRMTLRWGDRGVSAVFGTDQLIEASKGAESAQMATICKLAELVRSLEG
jgi:hypothetical protein